MTTRQVRRWTPRRSAAGSCPAVAAAGTWIVGLSTGGSKTRAEPTADTSAPTSADVDQSADELRSTLARLGFDMVDVEVREGTVQVRGSVASEQDLAALRSAALASVDPGVLDIRQVIVDPAAVGPPPGFPPPDGQPGRLTLMPW